MKIILGLTGEIASGKETVAKYLAEKYGSSSYRFSGILRDVAKRIHLEENRENLQKISTMFREYFGSDILAKTIYLNVKNDKHEIVAINGVRRFEDVEFLKKLPEFKLIYIETDLEKRYERLVKRRENADDATKTFEDFKKDLEREAESEIKALRDKADVVVENNGTREELYAQVDKIINKN
jgi:dephospho-CoA kinase